MKTLFPLLCFSVLLQTIGSHAADALRDKPMLLCYAARSESRITVDTEIREIEAEELAVVSSRVDALRAKPLPVPALGYNQALWADDPAPISIYFAQGLSLKTASNWERLHRANFCLGNLLEGSVYDFKKKNDLRLEIAGPRQECRENCSQVKYEQFYLTFLFSLKL